MYDQPQPYRSSALEHFGTIQRRDLLRFAAAPFVVGLLAAAAAPGAIPAEAMAAAQTDSQATAAPTVATAAGQAGLIVQQADAPLDLSAWQPVRGGTLTYVTTISPTSLDPARADFWSMRGGGLWLYEGLLVRGPNYEFVPSLATSWTHADDWKSWTFQLRQDVKFHDGTPFNAQAVKFNFDRAMDSNNTPGVVAAALPNLDSVAVIDDYTVQLNMKQLNVLALNDLTADKVAFASPTAVQKFGDDFGRNPVGTGPCVFDHWVEDQAVYMKRNPDYNWGPAVFKNTGPIFPDNFVVRIIRDTAAQIAAIQAGEVDWIYHDRVGDLQQFFGSSDWAVVGVAEPGTPDFLHINTQRWPTDDIKVRQALNLAIDKAAVTQRLYAGLSPLAGNILVPGTIGYNPDLETRYPFDVTLANKMLDDQGYTRRDDGFRYRDNKRMQVEFPNIPNPLSELYKLDIEKNLGIFVDITPVEWATFIAGLAQKQYTHAWWGIPGPDGDVLYPLYHSSNYAHPVAAFSFFINSDLDNLLDGARADADEQSRAQKWQQAQQILMDNAVAIPLTVAMNFSLYSLKTIGGRAWNGVELHRYVNDLYSVRQS
jgi:peptide/nickel transport system substrate-binding protein